MSVALSGSLSESVALSARVTVLRVKTWPDCKPSISQGTSFTGVRRVRQTPCRAYRADCSDCSSSPPSCIKHEMDIGPAQPARRFSVASSSTSSDYDVASLWTDGASMASSPGTSYSSSFGRSSSFVGGRRRAGTCSSAHVDTIPRLQPLSEHSEDPVETSAGSTTIGFSDAIPDIMPLADDEATGPQHRSGLAKRLVSGTRKRASSIGRLQLIRPKLERREAGPDGNEDRPSTGSRTPSIFGSKRFRQLKGRFAYSAPVTPSLTPSVSTDKVHLFLSRPNSVVLRGTGSDLQASFYFDAIPGSPLLDSPTASVYAPALEDQIAIPAEVSLAESVVLKPLNRFDGVLPREVRIAIFAKVIENSIEEQANCIESGKWTANLASETRWSGKAEGLKTLVGLSRVSREWRDLAFDGQLWQNVSLARQLGPDALGIPGLIRLASHSGSYLRKLDLRGFRNLQNEDLEVLTDACRAGAGTTHLEYIDLTGMYRLHGQRKAC